MTHCSAHHSDWGTYTLNFIKTVPLKEILKKGKLLGLEATILIEKLNLKN